MIMYALWSRNLDHRRRAHPAARTHRGDADTADLVRAPCGRHALCEADLNGWFQRATENESLFPPKCCGISITPGEYEPYLDAEVLRAYQAKAKGEYSVLAR